jgi:DNA-binding GntR family transcriptional regulator
MVNPKVNKISRTQRAFLQIKNLILQYSLKPGMNLNIGQLAKSLQMSQTPIREALIMLKNEFLVEHMPGRGFIVSGFEKEDIGDMFDLRLVIEELAVKQAVKRMDKKDLDYLENNLKKASSLMKNENIEKTLKNEQDFHIILLRASKNKLLLETGQLILDRIWRVIAINVYTSGQVVGAHDQHAEVFDAIKSKDSRRAKSLIRKHILYSKKNIISRLYSHNVFNANPMLNGK